MFVDWCLVEPIFVWTASTISAFVNAIIFAFHWWIMVQVGDLNMAEIVQNVNQM